MTALAEKQAHVWQRDELDWYVEPERATMQLLSVETFNGPIWDPACGQGNIVKVCQMHDLEAFGSDIADRGFGGVQDFLDPDFEFVNVTNIIMNPPFFRAKGCEAFIRRAIDLDPRKLAVFADIRFLAGAQRASGLFAAHPPSRVWIITPRVSCPPGEFLAAGNEASGGSADWCWLVWERGHVGTQLGWLT